MVKFSADRSYIEVFIFFNNFGREVGGAGCLLASLAAGVQLNFRAGSTFPFPVCTVPSSMDRTSRCKKVDGVRLYASYRLNLLLLKGQICVS